MGSSLVAQSKAVGKPPSQDGSGIDGQKFDQPKISSSPLGLGSEIYEALGAAIYFEGRQSSTRPGKGLSADISVLQPAEQRIVLQGIAEVVKAEIAKPQSRPSLEFLIQLALDGVPLESQIFSQVIGDRESHPLPYNSERAVKTVMWLRELAKIKGPRSAILIHCEDDFQRITPDALADMVALVIVEKAVNRAFEARKCEMANRTNRLNSEVLSHLNEAYELALRMMLEGSRLFDGLRADPGWGSGRNAVLIETLARAWVNNPKEANPEAIKSFALSADERCELALKLLDYEARMGIRPGSVAPALIPILKPCNPDMGTLRKMGRCQEYVFDYYVNRHRLDAALRLAVGFGQLGSKTDAQARDFLVAAADRIVGKTSQLPIEKLDHHAATKVYDQHFKNLGKLSRVNREKILWIRDQLREKWPVGSEALFVNDAYKNWLGRKAPLLPRWERESLVQGMLVLGTSQAADRTAKKVGVKITRKMLVESALMNLKIGVALAADGVDCEGHGNPRVAARYLQGAYVEGVAPLKLSAFTEGVLGGVTAPAGESKFLKCFLALVSYIDCGEEDIKTRKCPGRDESYPEFLARCCAEGLRNNSIRPRDILTLGRALSISDLEFLKSVFIQLGKTSASMIRSDLYVIAFDPQECERNGGPAISPEEFEALGRWMYGRILCGAHPCLDMEQAVGLRLKTMIPVSPRLTRLVENAIRIEAASVLARRFVMVEREYAVQERALEQDPVQRRNWIYRLAVLAGQTLKIQNPAEFNDTSKRFSYGGSHHSYFRKVGFLTEFAVKLSTRPELEPVMAGVGSGREGPIEASLKLLKKIDPESSILTSAARQQQIDDAVLEGNFREAVRYAHSCSYRDLATYIRTMADLAQRALVGLDIDSAHEAVDYVHKLCAAKNLALPPQFSPSHQKNVWSGCIPRGLVYSAVKELSLRGNILGLITLEERLREKKVREALRLFVVPDQVYSEVIGKLRRLGAYVTLKQATEKDSDLRRFIAAELLVENLRIDPKIKSLSIPEMEALVDLQPAARHGKILDGAIRARRDELTPELFEKLVDPEEYTAFDLYSLLFERRSGIPEGEAGQRLAQKVVCGSYLVREALNRKSQVEIRRMMELLLAARPARASDDHLRLKRKARSLVGAILSDRAQHAVCSCDPEIAANFERTLRTVASWCGDKRFEKIFG